MQHENGSGNGNRNRNGNKSAGNQHRHRFGWQSDSDNIHKYGHPSHQQFGEKRMTLDELKTGSTAVITVVGGSGALRRRLLDMGLTPKTRVQILKVAPMGDPIVLRLRGYDLTVRREDTGKIEISEVE